MNINFNRQVITSVCVQRGILGRQLDRQVSCGRKGHKYCASNEFFSCCLQGTKPHRLKELFL